MSQKALIFVLAAARTSNLTKWVFRLLSQRVWQTAYNRIIRVRQIIVRVYFRAYNRILVEGEFAVGYCCRLVKYVLTFKKINVKLLAPVIEY
jgi:hypothetical protein